MSKQAAVQAEGLTLSHGSVRALDDVSFSVASGGRLGVLGPSGAGKTTLLRALAGLAVPEKGVVTIGGSQATADGRLLIPPERRGVGLVFQSLALWPHMTVERTLSYVAQGAVAERHFRAGELAEAIGLSKRLDAFPGELSGGEQQRLAIARALAPRPRVLLLDEPFAHLDAPLRQSLAAMLLELQQEHRFTLVLVTHQRRGVFQLAEQLLVLEDGATRDCGELEQLTRRPRHPSTIRLLGLGTLLGGERVDGRLRTAIGDLEVEGEGTQALVRPDQVSVLAGDAGDDLPAGVVQSCTIARPDALSDYYQVLVAVDGALVRASTERAWSSGEQVRLLVTGTCPLL